MEVFYFLTWGFENDQLRNDNILWVNGWGRALSQKETEKE